MIEYIEHNGRSVAVVGRTISGVQDALDIMAEISWSGCDKMIIKKELLPDAFFSLKTGLAGEILQKFTNYRMKLAIVGDFENIKSNALSDFIYESNKGSQVFFKKSIEEASEILSKV